MRKDVKIDTKKMEKEIEKTVRKLTLDEKLAMIHGATLFQSGAVERLGIPAIITSDGPMGVRAEFMSDRWIPAGNNDDMVSYLPSNSALASTWNPKLAHDMGHVLGAEARGRGKDVILAPGINIKRDPKCGRNFEYMSEDPKLAATLAVPFIQGVQENDVAACVKHFAANCQETDRLMVDEEIDDRTLYEIYLPAFKAAVQEGGAYSIMGAYNKINGYHCCENKMLLDGILRMEWGFDGAVISDWGGVHKTKEAAECSMDLEMSVFPDFDDYKLANPLKELVEKGEVSEDRIDAKVRNLLRMMYRLKLNDEPKCNSNAQGLRISAPQPAEPPAQVTGLKTSARGANGVNLTLSWNAVDGATGYNVYGYNKPADSWTLLDTVTTNKFISPTTPGYEYYFRVAAVNGDVEGTPSDALHTCAACETMDAPSVIASNDKTIQVDWNLVGSHGYVVMWSKDASFKTGVSNKYITGHSKSNYTISVPSGANQYYVRVRAWRNWETGYVYGSWSEGVKAGQTIAKVTGLKTSARGANGVNLTISWNAQAAADSYNVYGYNKANDSWTLLGNVTTNKYISPTTPGYEYIFRVAAVEDGREGVPSERLHTCAACETMKGFARSPTC